MPLSQRTLAGVLSLYQNAGYRLVFSSDLIPRDAVVTHNPPPAEALSRLTSVLRGFALRMEWQESSQTWYVVRDLEGRLWLRLRVVDADSGEPIVGAVARLGEKELEARSDHVGELSLSIPFAADATLSIKHPDYQPVMVDKLHDGEERLLLMHSNSDPAEEIVVTASAYRIQPRAAGEDQRFDGVDIGYQPTRGGDVVQLMQHLPGMASSGVSAKPHIRGGEQNELLILFDGVELIDPFHLNDMQGLLSAINPSVVAAMDVYAGAYPARYGSRMSGVLDIQVREVDTAIAELEHNLLATSAYVARGSADTDARWQLAARRGNLDEFLDVINPAIGTPRFQDLFLRYQHPLADAAMLSIGALVLDDDVVLHMPNNGENASSIYRSQYLWSALQVSHDSGAESLLRFTSAHIDNARSGEREASTVELDSAGLLSDQRRFDVVRLEYFYARALSENTELEWGLRGEYAKGRYDYHIEQTHGLFGQRLGRAEQQRLDVEAEYEGGVSEAFANYRFSPVTDAYLEFGLRADGQTWREDSFHQVSPRLAAKYLYSDALTLRLSAGRMHQSPRITELDVEGGQTEFYDAQKADHLVLGALYEFDSGASLLLEIYSKRFYSPQPRHENLFDRYLLLPELAPDRVTFVPERAQSRGLDLRWTQALGEQRSVWLSYSVSRVEDLVAGERQLRAWDQEHALSSGFLATSGPWSWSGQVQWHSGWPITRLSDEIGQTAVDVSPNNARLQDFIVLSTKVDYHWRKSTSDIHVYLELNNLSNRANEGAYRYFLEPTDSGEYALRRDKQRLLPILPILGVQWRF